MNDFFKNINLFRTTTKIENNSVTLNGMTDYTHTCVEC